MNQRLGAHALGSQLKLLQMTDQRRRRTGRRDDEGPAIASCPAEPLVPVVGNRSMNLRVGAGLPACGIDTGVDWAPACKDREMEFGKPTGRPGTDGAAGPCRSPGSS